MSDILQELDEVLARKSTRFSVFESDTFLRKHAPEIRAALELQAKLADGWMLVPREPTPQMCVAGFLTGTPDGFDVETPADAPGLVYRAMLAVAEKEPTNDQ